MSKYHNFMQKLLSRREMLEICKGGFGSLAFMSLFGTLPMACATSSNPIISPNLNTGSHYLPKAKNIIFL